MEVLQNKLEQLRNAAQAAGISALPHRDLAAFAWDYLFPQRWREEGRTDFAERFVQALLAPLQAATEYAAWGKALANPRATPDENLGAVLLWTNLPDYYRLILPEWGYRGLASRWRFVQKYAGLPPALGAMEPFIPGLQLDMWWHPSVPYRRIVVAQLPLEGLGLSALKVLVRSVIPPSLEIELNYFPVSRVVCAAGANEDFMYAWWMGDAGDEGNAWLNDEDTVVEVI